MAGRRPGHPPDLVRTRPAAGPLPSPRRLGRWAKRVANGSGASGPNGGQIGNLFGHGGGLPGGGVGDRPTVPTNRPEDAGLDRLKPHRGSRPYDTPVAALRQEGDGIAAGIETAGVSC